MAEVCNLSGDAKSTFEELMQLKTKNCVLILKCDGKKGEVCILLLLLLLFFTYYFFV